MGSWFSNIQIRHSGETLPFDPAHIAAIFTQKHDLKETDKDHADIEITVFKPQNSQWISVFSDLIDEDIEPLLEYAKEISQALKTETLAISCFDSDYLFINLIDEKKSVDAWASCGKYPDGKAPRKSSFSAWKPYVTDLKAFRKSMRERYVFAEECLQRVEALLSLPVLQSMNDGSECEEASRFYFQYTQEKTAVRSPALSCLSRPLHYRTGPNLVSIRNEGDSSRGIGVCFTGPCIQEKLADITDVFLKYRGKQDEWASVPIDLQMKEFGDGVQRLYGECREILIPPAVSPKLPWKKKMDLEFQRSISICFSLAYKNASESTENAPGEMHVIIIPLQNFSGQCGIVLKPEPSA